MSGPISVEAVIRTGARLAGVPEAVLVGRDTSRFASVPRHAVMLAARLGARQVSGAPASFPRIGKALGRDHTTVISGVAAASKGARKCDAAARALARLILIRLGAPAAVWP